jgi:hypothetical protein
MLKHMRQQQDQARATKRRRRSACWCPGWRTSSTIRLSNISTSAQLLLEEDEAGEPEMKHLWLAQIDSETERARRIVRRLLDSVRHPKLHCSACPSRT